MPKEITHWTLAERAFRRLEETSPLKPILLSYKHLYLCGAVILDSPLYAQFGNGAAWIRGRSEKLHDTAENAFDCVASIFKTPLPVPLEAVLALLLGITTHIYVDATFHPLVCYFSGASDTVDEKRRRKAQARHHTLEAYLDVYFASRSPFSLETTFSAFFNAIEIPRAGFFQVLSALYRIKEAASVQKALSLHALLQPLFHRVLFRKMLEILNRLPGVNLEAVVSNFYPLNPFRANWLFPGPIFYRDPVTGDARHVSVETLERDALESIQEAFQVLGKHMQEKRVDRGFTLLEGPNLYTGKMGCRRAQMRYFNGARDLMALIGR